MPAFRSFLAAAFCCVLPFGLLVGSASAATIVVNTVSDELNSNGDCSLREAIQAANLNRAVGACAAGEPGLDRIIVEIPVLDPQLELPLGELLITEALTITGEDSPNVTVDGVFATRLFRIAEGVGPVTFTAMRLASGQTNGQGGAMLIEEGANVVIHNVVMERSRSAGGGAICNLGGTVSIHRTVIKRNEARGTAGAGGAILNVQGSLSLLTVTLWQNSASNSGGGIENFAGEVVLDDVTFDDNETGRSPGHGGGLHSTEDGTVSIIRSVFWQNSALQGGGLWSAGALTLEETLLRDNEARGVGAIEGGGGFYNAGGTAVVRKSTFWNNIAASSTGGGLINAGGGTLDVTYSTFSGNAAQSGGGLAIAAGEAELWNTTVASNTASEAGGGVVIADGVLTVGNTIIGDNAGTLGPDCLGALVSAGYNVLEETAECDVVVDQWDVTGQNPGLAPLAGNGGQAPTHALLPDSPARDVSGTCGPSDQRGLPAPVYGFLVPTRTTHLFDRSRSAPACDAGAVEGRAEAVPIVGVFAPVNPPVVIPAEGGRFLFTFTMTNVSNRPVPFELWTEVTLPDSVVLGPLLGPGAEVLDPGKSVTYTLEQSVPAGAPTGTYTYGGMVGYFPNGIMLSNGFSFSKAASAGQDGPEVVSRDGWTVARIGGEGAAPLPGRPDGPEASAARPSVVALAPARPNPFASRAALAFVLPEASHVRLAVYDVLGREVAVLVDEPREAGRHEAVLEAGALPSGTYLVRLKAGNTVQIERVTLVR